MKNKGNEKFILGVICMLISGVGFASMNLLVRLSGDLPSYQKSIFRNGVVFFIALFFFLKEKKPANLPKGGRKILWLRAIMGFIGLQCNFYAVDHLPISDASMLNHLSPFFVIIFSYFFLRESINHIQVGMILVALFGAGLVARPSFSNTDLFAYGIAILGGISAGVAYTSLRALTSRGANKNFVILFFAGFSTVAIIPVLLFTFKAMNTQQVILLLLAGVCGAIGQYGITAAYSFAPARSISIFDYFQVLFAAILSMLVLGEYPSRTSVIGYFVIFGAALTLFFYNYRNAKRQNEAASLSTTTKE